MSYYDHYAESPVTDIGSWMKRKAAKRQVALLEHHLANRDARILEIGPGSGHLAIALLEAGYHNYEAVEPNDILRGRLESIGVPLKDYLIPCLLEEDASYDVIVLCHVFEHLRSPVEVERFMTEARRVLRSGGLLWILSPDFLHAGKDFFNGDYGHNNVTTLRRTMQLLHDHGFRTIWHSYHSGFFQGFVATAVSYLVRLSLFWAHGSGLDDKLYNIKTTFLRSFLVGGRKLPPNISM